MSKRKDYDAAAAAADAPPTEKKRRVAMENPPLLLGMPDALFRSMFLQQPGLLAQKELPALCRVSRAWNSALGPLHSTLPPLMVTTDPLSLFDPPLPCEPYAICRKCRRFGATEEWNRIFCRLCGRDIHIYLDFLRGPESRKKIQDHLAAVPAMQRNDAIHRALLNELKVDQAAWTAFLEQDLKPLVESDRSWQPAEVQLVVHSFLGEGRRLTCENHLAMLETLFRHHVQPFKKARFSTVRERLVLPNVWTWVASDRVAWCHKHGECGMDYNHLDEDSGCKISELHQDGHAAHQPGKLPLTRVKEWVRRSV